MRGKGCVHGRNDFNLQDHPRLCGEKYDFVRLALLARGSPPPMRGKGSLVQTAFTFLRITPAYAGKSFLSTSRAFCNQDHPRLCGEKPQAAKNVVEIVGSPPPMRGKAAETHPAGFHKGITPAYAGKSFHLQISGISSRGSPPPMRGKVHIYVENIQSFGITPAYAGKR